MRHATALVLFATAFAFSATSFGQSVEFRIVERTGKMLVETGIDPTISFAVQARVVGGAPAQFLGNFAFDIVASGEADANGSLHRLLISNIDGTYAENPTQSVNNSVGAGGMASVYTYLAGITPMFNGLINSSGGPFTNTAANQEIGGITGSPTGTSLLRLADTTGSGNPDTYPGSGVSAPMDPVLAQTYLGANGNFVDVYRFKYILSNFAPRQITFSLANLRAQVGDSLLLTSGSWGAVQTNAPATFVGVTVGVVPAPASAAALGLAGLLAIRRRRAPQ
jgi:hypothetical protein